ncbi:cupin-like domain-containing protein [Lentzea sp. HUAS TT2]|uniref:cupin-like domain-containing protein n=1 Tax=Lentzea sp. HUAS TT2 TaxID=3447454 RepID=UPI003F72188B
MLDLATLVAPHTIEDFLAGEWPRAPYISIEDADRVATFAEAVPELDSAESLLSSWQDRVSLMSPKGFRASVQDGRTALPFLRQGFTCYLRNLENHIPVLSDLLDSVAAQLGVPRKYMICEVFCSEGESGVAMHSDYDHNFALLLRGAKKWTFSHNTHIRHATNTIIGGDRPQRDKRQLEFATSLPLPDKQSDDAQVVTVRGGGMVFMPRDWWHQTEAIGECMQLNVAVKGPMWLTVFQEALTETLVSDVEWRDMAYGIVGDETARESALDAFTELVGRFRKETSGDSDRELAKRLIEAAGCGD